MRELRRIRRLYAVIARSLYTIEGRLGYERITEAVNRLAWAVHTLDTVGDGCGSDYDDEALWSIGEHDAVSLPDFIVGAYWHYCDWHGGQSSPEYAALCALGRIFEPGMSSIESERADGSPACQAYDALDAMATTRAKSEMRA